MLIPLRCDHKQNVLRLVDEAPQVVRDFCKLATDYLDKGPNFRIYNSAAQKQNVEPKDILCIVEGLVNLLFESCKSKLTPDDFRDMIVALGFSGENESAVCQLYADRRDDILAAIVTAGIRLPEFINLEWRFEAQIASKSLVKQVTPLVTLDLSLKNCATNGGIDEVLLQTDPNNLKYITEALEQALQEGRNQHLRKIARDFK